MGASAQGIPMSKNARKKRKRRARTSENEELADKKMKTQSRGRACERSTKKMKTQSRGRANAKESTKTRGDGGEVPKRVPTHRTPATSSLHRTPTHRTPTHRPPPPNSPRRVPIQEIRLSDQKAGHNVLCFGEILNSLCYVC